MAHSRHMVLNSWPTLPTNCWNHSWNNFFWSLAPQWVLNSFCFWFEGLLTIIMNQKYPISGQDRGWIWFGHKLLFWPGLVSVGFGFATSIQCRSQEIVSQANSSALIQSNLPSFWIEFPDGPTSPPLNLWPDVCSLLAFLHLTGELRECCVVFGVLKL